MTFRPDSKTTHKDDAGYYMLYKDGQLLTDLKSSDLCIFTEEQARSLVASPNQSHFIGYWREKPCYAWSVQNELKFDQIDYSFATLYQMLGRIPDVLFAAAGRGQQIISWYEDNQYCGRCGNSMSQHEAERAMMCVPCKQMIFPRISPCIIVLITRGDEVLLAQGVGFPNGMYSTLAGFVEAGETPEEAVIREVREEVGVEIENICYFKSQPWPFPSQLMLGFYAEYKSGDIVPDSDEIVDAKWCKINDLPNTPPANAISGQLIAAYIKNRQS